MKILLITEFFPDLKKLNFSGGVETRTFFIARNLTGKNKVMVICRRKKGENREERSTNLKIIRLGREVGKTEAKFSSIFGRLIFIVQSFIFALKFKPELVEGSNFVCYLSAWLVGKFKKIPTVAWYPDLLGKEWLRGFGILTGLSGLILERISLCFPWTTVIALSEETKKKLIRQGIKKEKIEVVYGGVALELTHAVKVKKSERPTICCISRLVSYKRVDCLIQAVNLIKKKIPDIQLIIIGKGPEAQRLRRLREDLELKENIIFRKNLSYKRLIEILKSSHLFCLPSEIEGFGLATLEAASVGVPFVTVDLPISREVTKGKGGLFYKKGDSRDLSRKIIRILEDNVLYKSLSSEAKDMASSYSWSRISQQTERAYEKVLNNR